MFLALPVQTEVDICGVSIYYCVNRKAFVKSVSYSYLHVHNVPDMHAEMIINNIVPDSGLIKFGGCIM